MQNKYQRKRSIAQGFYIASFVTKTDADKERGDEEEGIDVDFEPESEKKKERGLLIHTKALLLEQGYVVSRIFSDFKIINKPQKVSRENYYIVKIQFEGSDGLRPCVLSFCSIVYVDHDIDRNLIVYKTNKKTNKNLERHSISFRKLFSLGALSQTCSKL